MELSNELLNKIISVTSNAAIACYPHVGKKDKILADKAATDVMRKNLNVLDINGEVVIGEGELDKAPMLFIGEKLGSGKGPSIDIAVDPVEGTNFAANNLPGALCVLAISIKGNLFKAPETYMNKISVGKEIPKDAVDLDFSVEKNIKNIADSMNKDINKVTACILDRPRHKKFIDELKLIIKENNIEGIIVGNPINMDGSLSRSSQSIKDVCKNILKNIDVPLCLWDERLSTVGAFNLSSQLDVNVSKKVKNIDKNAAAFILQGAIDYLKN